MTTRPTSTDDLEFLDQFEKVEHSENRLPHWQQSGATFFVTFRLADSIPQDRLDQWTAEKETWLKWNPPPWSTKQEQEYHERFTSQIEAWLDEGSGNCLLRQPASRAIVAQALNHFDGHRCWQHSWVVMPNHVHALFSLIEYHPLEDLLRSWKGYSSRAVHKLQDQHGTLWMKDYFDRMIRDSRHFWRCARYIRRNPGKAKLKADGFTFYEALFVKEKLDFEAGHPSARIDGFPVGGNRNGAFPGAEEKEHKPGRLESRPSTGNGAFPGAEEKEHKSGRPESRPSAGNGAFPGAAESDRDQS